MLFLSQKTRQIAVLGLVSAMSLIVGCSSFELRSATSGSGGGFDRASVKRAPLEIKSEEVLPYTARLTYGEICVNSKRYGRQFCFPCYNQEGGGCDAAIEDLVDKAVACSAPIGPNSPRLPTFSNTFPTAPFTTQPNYSQFTPPAAVPNVYPNFSR